MPQLSFVTLDVFTQTRYAGNPLAIVRVPAGDHHVSPETMQTLAREFNLSETLFLHDGQPGDDDGVLEWRVRIFLTDHEVPFAGHPTIGAAVYALGTLAPPDVKHGRLIANAGPIEVSFANNNGAANASIPHNVHIHTQYPFTLEQVYSLQPTLRGTLKSRDAIQVLSPVRGMSFVTVALPDLESLATITSSSKPAPRLDDAWNTGFAGSYFYVVARRAPEAEEEKKLTGDAEQVVRLRTRMIEGSFEDPATGSAACALASYLALRSGSRRVTRFEVTQGVEMGRKSDIGVSVTLSVDFDAVEKIELSGAAVKVMEGVLEY